MTPKWFKLWQAKSCINNDVFRRSFYKKIATLLNNGVKLDESLQMMKAQAERSKSPSVIFYNDILASLSAGVSFNASLSHWVSSGESMMVAAGERAGKLPEVLFVIERDLKIQSKIKGVIRSALNYPIAMMVATMGIMVFIGNTVIPKIARMSNPESWTGVAKSLYVVSTFMSSGGYMIVLAVLLVLGVLIKASMARTLGKGQFRSILDKCPPWSFYEKFQSASFMMALSVMLSSGTRIQEALFIMYENGSPWLKQRLSHLITSLDSGTKNLGVSMSQSPIVFPSQEIIDDMVVYANQKGFDSILNNYGKELADRTLEQVEKNAGVLKGAGVVILFMAIGWIVLGVLGIQQAISLSIR
jgi:type II secretory pathway component PulF